jgi:hypothetical protein
MTNVSKHTLNQHKLKYNTLGASLTNQHNFASLKFFDSPAVI